MNLRHALRAADPAQHLLPQQLDTGTELLLRDILDTPSPTAGPAGRSKRSQSPHRLRPARPLIVTIVTAVVLLAASLGVLQLTHRPAAPAAPGTRHDSAALLDPLREITDRSSELYVSDSPQVILHVRADSSRTFTLDVPAGVKSVRLYLVCTSGSTYTLTTDTTESGGCRGSIGGYNEQSVAESPRTVKVTVPAGTSYFLLAIPTPTTSTKPGSPIQLPPLAYPQNAAPAGDPLIGHARGTSSDRVVGQMTAKTQSLFVVITCRGVGTLVISTQDGFTHGSAAEAPNPKLCGSIQPITTHYGDQQDGGMQHYGPMNYAIQPFGDISWTVSFYNGH